MNIIVLPSFLLLIIWQKCILLCYAVSKDHLLGQSVNLLIKYKTNSYCNPHTPSDVTGSL